MIHYDSSISLIMYSKLFYLHSQIEAESFPEISQKYEITAVPTCVLIKVCSLVFGIPYCLDLISLLMFQCIKALKWD